MKSDYGYTMTLKEFFDKGYKLEVGDEVFTTYNKPRRINSSRVLFDCNVPERSDNERHIKKSAQLEREDLHQYMRYGLPINRAAMPYGIAYMVDTYASETEADRQQYIKEFNQEAKMKPFNLERALAGDKVITRDGREVTQLTKFDVGPLFSEDCLYCVVGGAVYSFNESGAFDCHDSEMDLFMASKIVKHQRWALLGDDGAFAFYGNEFDARCGASGTKAKVRLIEWGVEE